MLYTLRERDRDSTAPGTRYDVVLTTGEVIATILRPGLAGNHGYGLYLPSRSADGRPCWRIQGDWPGTWHATAADALAALPACTYTEER
jgi:hypothetical protein